MRSQSQQLRSVSLARADQRKHIPPPVLSRRCSDELASRRPTPLPADQPAKSGRTHERLTSPRTPACLFAFPSLLRPGGHPALRARTRAGGTEPASYSSPSELAGHAEGILFLAVFLLVVGGFVVLQGLDWRGVESSADLGLNSGV
ncbi:hypothetical protein BDA96_01G363500 [Sorghum bicolor]|uniref:Uncharacterized protein n=2 Tax=Sorghum bicolor TaxID=4558 RepID=A0A921S3K4_SORBI|nr:hypothetical protein BDA96_01G363500 [Sorghum bicolor]KAG0550730.1 hypothetical protein BDA96_01G363500 [Sorghum bicolor]KXG39156.1 hypothetical protein SORBI_3001G339900 [Sorghum bicolor]